MNARPLRSMLILLAILTCAATAAYASGEAPAAYASGETPAQSTHKATTVRKSSTARKPAAKKSAAEHQAHAVTAAGAASQADPATTAHDKSAGLPRRLDEINIEGEIAVPQVLFVTARDQRRFMDFQQRRYVKSSLEVGTEKAFPTWIAVIHPTTADPHKETHP